MELDASDAASRARLASAVAARFDRSIDLLIVNAGEGGGDRRSTPGPLPPSPGRARFHWPWLHNRRAMHGLRLVPGGTGTPTGGLRQPASTSKASKHGAARAARRRPLRSPRTSRAVGSRAAPPPQTTPPSATPPPPAPARRPGVLHKAWSPQGFAESTAVNFRGAIDTALALGPHLAEGALVIFVSSSEPPRPGGLGSNSGRRGWARAAWNAGGRGIAPCRRQAGRTRGGGWAAPGAGCRHGAP